MDKHLEILGLTRTNVTLENIQTRFKKLTLIHHPDKNGNTDFYRMIIEAREYLIKHLEITLTKKRNCIYPNCKESCMFNYCEKHSTIKLKRCAHMNYSPATGYRQCETQHTQNSTYCSEHN